MILSKLTMEWTGAGWARVRERSGDRMRKVLERMPVRETADSLERMSLGELLYHALLGDGAEMAG